MISMVISTILFGHQLAAGTEASFLIILIIENPVNDVT